MLLCIGNFGMLDVFANGQMKENTRVYGSQSKRKDISRKKYTPRKNENEEKEAR